MDIKKVRVVIIDDSAVFRRYLTQVLAPHGRLEIVATFSDPREALPQIAVLKPDVLIVDMEMPGMRGNEFLRRALPTNPRTRAIVISSRSDNVFDAMRAGAIDFVEKPGGNMTNTEFASDLLQKVNIAAAANARAVTTREPLKAAAAAAPLRPLTVGVQGSRNVIAIGASTGGTEAILEVVRQFPRNMPGVIMVQHMPAGFTKMYADRLDKVCQMNVREAIHGDRVEQGVILLAPGGDRQMRLKKDANGFYVQLAFGEKVSGHCPSVDVMFESVAETAGAAATGVLLTGMGADGAQGLKKMRQAGAHTIGQDEKTCIVYGMPKVAFDIGAVARQLPLPDIGASVVQRFRV